MRHEAVTRTLVALLWALLLPGIAFAASAGPRSAAAVAQAPVAASPAGQPPFRVHPPLPGPPGRAFGRAQGQGQPNPMFGDPTRTLAVRERVLVAVASCFVALYVLFLIVRLLLPRAPSREAAPGAAKEEPSARPAEAIPADPLLCFEQISDFRIFLIYLLVAMAVTFPAIFKMTTRVVGDNASDVWKHVWGFWWVKDALLRHGVMPLHTDCINAPFGGSLYCIDALNALLSVPLQLVMPLPMAFNVVVLLQLAFGAYAAYCLVRYLCGSSACAIPAGIVYAFSPYVMAYPVTSGVTETLNLGWIPCAVLYWLKTLREPSRRHALRLGILVFLTVFGSFYYGAFLMLLLFVMTVGAAAAWGVRLLRMARAERPAEIGRVRRGAAHCVAGVALGLVMSLLPVAAFFYTTAQPDSIIPNYVRARAHVNDPYMDLVSRNYATLVSYVAPGKQNLQSTFTSDRLSRTTYLGYTVLIWVVIGLTCGGWARTAGLLTLFFVLVSLGPYMVITDQLHLDAPTSPLYLLLYRFVPLFPSVAIPYRMALMVGLFASVVMAFGMARVLGGQPPALQNLLGLAIGAQVLLEFAIASPAPYPAPLASVSIPPFYRQIAAEKRGGVLDLPPTRWNTELTPGEYFLFQTVHRKPIPYTISGTFWQSLNGNAFTRMLCYPHAQMPDGLPPPPRATVDWLRQSGFRYVVVHPSIMEPADVAGLDAVLTRYLGPAARQRGGDGSLHVYVVDTEERRQPKGSLSRR